MNPNLHIYTSYNTQVPIVCKLFFTQLNSYRPKLEVEFFFWHIHYSTFSQITNMSFLIAILPHIFQLLVWYFIEG